MNPQLIAEIAALIVQGGELAFTLFVKLEPLLHLGPSEQQNIANAIAAADNADKNTIARAAQWALDHGLTPPSPPLTQ